MELTQLWKQYTIIIVAALENVVLSFMFLSVLTFLSFKFSLNLQIKKPGKGKQFTGLHRLLNKYADKSKISWFTDESIYFSSFIILRSGYCHVRHNRLSVYILQHGDRLHAVLLLCIIQQSGAMEWLWQQMELR